MKKKSLNSLYHAIGISKQAVHAHLDGALKQADLEAQIQLIVQQVRVKHPDMGIRTIYHKMSPIQIGRDAFEDICRANGLMRKPFKNYHITTDSSQTRFYPNYIENAVPNAPNQIWQSDITYFEINKHFYYITLIQDAFTKIIVAAVASDNLTTLSTTLPAYRMAFKTLDKQEQQILISHSDGGGQYYAKVLSTLHNPCYLIRSMGKSCYENAMAESINGVLKNKYLYLRPIHTFADLKRELDRTVSLYNEDKPHSALQRMTPIAFKNKWISCNRQTDARMTESISAKVQMNGASCPIHLSQTDARNPDVICAINDSQTNK